MLMSFYSCFSSLNFQIESGLYFSKLLMVFIPNFTSLKIKLYNININFYQL